MIRAGVSISDSIQEKLARYGPYGAGESIRDIVHHFYLSFQKENGVTVLAAETNVVP